MTTEATFDIYEFIATVASGNFPLPEGDDIQSTREFHEALSDLLDGSGFNMARILGTCATAIRNLAKFQEVLVMDIVTLAEKDDE